MDEEGVRRGEGGWKWCTYHTHVQNSQKTKPTNMKKDKHFLKQVYKSFGV